MSASGEHRRGDPALLDGAWGHEAARLLALLRRDREHGVSVVAMREQGIEGPAQAIYMLQLAGYVIDRVASEPNGPRVPAYRLARGLGGVNGQSPDDFADER